MKKSELIEFLNEYDEEDYDVRVIDELGFEFELIEADWSNGPWLVINYDQDEMVGVLGAEWPEQKDDDDDT